jgi:hypothetical protein
MPRGDKDRAGIPSPNETQRVPPSHVYPKTRRARREDQALPL